MCNEADKLLKGRVRIIKYVPPAILDSSVLTKYSSVWRPLQKVKAWPLAFCDARTVRPDDLVACDIVRRRYVGETYFGKYNPDQKWYYISDLEDDDVVLLKIYDSDPDVLGKCKLVSTLFCFAVN